ncbi:MAG: penicillin-binding protein 1C [Deltaproteobacteria bacterium]|nr:penicillin-binding protein 1C [Deltaproteobacteria bacterium]
MRIFRKIVIAGAVLALGALLLDAVFPFPVERLQLAPSLRILDRRGEPLRFFLAPDGCWRFPVTLEEVTPELLTAIVQLEDRRFYHHPGVDPLAVARAFFSNLRRARVVSGASTITMQVARLAVPRRRTILAKIIESLRAVQLTCHYSKRQILTWYINLAPFGGNVSGVGAASWRYFGKDPKRLSLGEAALLAVLPRSPVRYDPFRNPGTARGVRDRALERLAASGAFTPQRVAAARLEPLPGKRPALPFLAPHFCQWLAQEARRRNLKNAAADNGVWVTTLDARLQRLAEERLRTRSMFLRRAGIHGAAMVALDIASREVLAWVGNIDFWDELHQGMVDNVRSRRSPGSALKPFLYALAFARGIIAPETRLLDVPTDFAGYAPENYDHLFYGAVSAHDALARSLNVPAVRLLNAVGDAAFKELLRAGGLTTLQGDRDYGLALALGGCEVRLLELVNMYASLADGGRMRRIRWLGQGKPEPVFPWLSPAACALTLDILQDVRRPELPDGWNLTRDVPAVAWKTGTSFGHRDAWALGVSRDLAIGVWTGNPDGKVVKGISGTRQAGPLLFDLFRALAPSTSPPRKEISSLENHPLCAVSGLEPTPHCPLVSGHVIRDVTALSRCSWHKTLLVEEESGLRLAGDCLIGRRAKEVTALVYPAELVSWLAGQGVAPPPLPELHPACTEVPDAAAPLIVSPAAGARLMQRPDAPQEFQKLALLASPAQGARWHYWYVDGRPVGKVAPDTPCFAELAPGAHIVWVTDDMGRTARRLVTILRQ